MLDEGLLQFKTEYYRGIRPRKAICVVPGGREVVSWEWVQHGRIGEDMGEVVVGQMLQGCACPPSFVLENEYRPHTC